MKLLLILLCLIETAWSSPFYKLHRTSDEPQLLINGLINGHFTYLEDRSKYGEEIDKLSDLYLDVRSRLSEAYVKNSRQYNLRKRPGENYQIGDKVWKKNHVLSNAAEGFAAKLAPAYILCTVHRVISPLVYQLVDKDGKNVGKYHMKDLKRYRGSEDEDQ
ncbi:hypothetical protein JTB14_017476 [Gonioctena quinquepunctata]|nr:hypothetical protein JTB14_017476 [Gonioctena quinquepunctata]